MDKDRVTLECFTGDAIRAHIPTLAELRITVFRDYPYLYNGDPVYEARYLRAYADSAQCLVVVAFDNRHDGKHPVGASTALPVLDESEEVKAPLRLRGYALERVFYFGESILMKSYRGCGLGKRFFELREAHARSLGYTTVCFCAVSRPDSHPRRPKDYRPLDMFWQQRGFRQQTNLTTTFSWRDLDEPHESPKTMGFWLKDL